MPTVNQTIKRILSEKEAGIATATDSMLAILENLRVQIIKEIGQAAVTSWDSYRLKQMLGSIESQISDYQARAQQETSGYIADMWDTGQLLVADPLAVAGISTGFHISSSTLEVLQNYANDRLASLFGDTWYKVKGELNLGIMGGKTPQEVAAAIGKNLKDPSIFGSIAKRAEAITQLEMGRAFSQSAEMRMEKAAQHVAGLGKQWLHAGHPKKSRPTHLLAHGQIVPANKPFKIGKVEMMYPRDPKAPIEEVMHCGCDHVPWHESWGESEDGFKLPMGQALERQQLKGELAA
jgi:hypothetical protein